MLDLVLVANRYSLKYYPQKEKNFAWEVSRVQNKSQERNIEKACASSPNQTKWRLRSSSCSPACHVRNVHRPYKFFGHWEPLGTLSNEKDKNAIGLISKATALKIHHSFLNIALLSRNYYDMKTPNFMHERTQRLFTGSTIPRRDLSAGS